MSLRFPPKLFSAQRTVLCAENAPVLWWALPREAIRRDERRVRAAPLIGVRRDGTWLHRIRVRRAENATMTTQVVASTIRERCAVKGPLIEYACACGGKRLATQASRAQAKACASHLRAARRSHVEHDHAARLAVAFVLSPMSRVPVSRETGPPETGDKNFQVPSMRALDNRVRRDRAEFRVPTKEGRGAPRRLLACE